MTFRGVFFGVIGRQLARPDAHNLGAIMNGFEQTYFSELQRLLLHPDDGVGATADGDY